MSFMEKLLDGVEVEWKALGEIGEFKYGYTAKAKESGTARFIRISDINSKGELIESDAKYVDISKDNEKYILHKNDLLMARTGATYGKTLFFNEDYPAIYAGFLIRLNFNKNILNPRYYWHFAQSNLFWNQAKKLVSGGGQPQFNANVLKVVNVPIPWPDNPTRSLEVQAEIVRILDAFTSLTAELTAELTTRKKQYEYYRDQLLTFEEGEVEWKTLGEIGTWFGGGTPSKRRRDYWENGTIPWVSPKDMKHPIVDSSKYYITEAAIKESSTKLIPANSIAIVVRSSILFKVLPSALIPVPVTLNQDMKAIIPYRDLIPNYLAHMIRSRGNDILRVARKTGGSVASIESGKLFSFRIPVPPLDEQARIVAILDKFDTLINSISEGLPREIELRQKQYEYYRDLLLSFPKPVGFE
ncbi:MAG: restriction endonuclease subunit S [Desulfobacter sp.]